MFHFILLVKIFILIYHRISIIYKYQVISYFSLILNIYIINLYHNIFILQNFIILFIFQHFLKFSILFNLLLIMNKYI